jgi:hypothetical protein
VEFAGPIAFAVLLVAAAGVGIYTSQLSNGPRKGRAKFLATGLFGAAFCAIGLVNLVGIHTSARSSFTGVIDGLTQSRGKNSSSSFYIWGADRRWRRVHCDYAGDHLTNGETVAVDILDFHSTLLRLTVIDGTYSDWSLTERDGTIGSAFGVGLGLFLILGARAKWQRDPEDEEVTRDPRVPLTGVDSESLLHLSKSDGARD